MLDTLRTVFLIFTLSTVFIEGMRLILESGTSILKAWLEGTL